MRFALLMALFLALPLAGFGKATRKIIRKPTNASGPAKVITFSCHEEGDDSVQALGMAYLRVSPKDENAASVTLSLYVQAKKNSFTNRTYQGQAVTVPGGHTISLHGGDNFMLHLHPAEQTTLPGLTKPLSCEATASLHSGDQR